MGWGKIENRDQHLVASPSKLACLRQCPELYKHKYIDGNKEQTDSMDFGVMCHMAILEPEKFNEKYSVLPTPTETNDLGLKELKEKAESLGLTQSGTKKELCDRIRTIEPLEPQLNELQEEIIAKGKQVITQAVYSKIEAIKTKVYGHPQLGRFLEVATKEKYGHYQDPKTGVILAFLSDAFLKIGNVGIILDFKFTKDWEGRNFERTNHKEGRHLLAACYSKAISEIEGFKYDQFVFVAIEPVAPFRMRLHQVDVGMMDAGLAELDFYLADFKERHEKNDFSPRDDQHLIKPTTLPSWAYETIKEVYE